MSLAEAVLRVKIFHVEVFYSGSLLRPEPDVVEEIRALTEITAVQQVMTLHGVQSAGTAYIVDENSQECWLYDVYLNDGELAYEHCVSSVSGVDRCGDEQVKNLNALEEGDSDWEDEAWEYEADDGSYGTAKWS